MTESEPGAVRTPGEVRQKLKQVMYRHLQKEIRESFNRSPEACRYNQPMNLQGLGPVHLCYYKDDGKPRRMLCDSRMYAGVRQAQNCPLWQPYRTKEAVKAEFKAIMASNDRKAIGERYPGIAALMWVLDGEGQSWVPDPQELDEVIQAVEVVPLTVPEVKHE